MQSYAKAIVATIGATIVAILAAFPDDNDVQKWGAIITAFVTAVGVYIVPNLDPRGVRQDESVQPPERGASDLVTVLVVCLVVIVVIALLTRLL